MDRATHRNRSKADARNIAVCPRKSLANETTSPGFYKAKRRASEASEIVPLMERPSAGRNTGNGELVIFSRSPLLTCFVLVNDSALETLPPSPTADSAA